MNHELAKKLKDTGFPQVKADWGIVYLPEKVTKTQRGAKFFRKEEYRRFPWPNASQFLTGGYEPIVLPTLSELIEACGTYFEALTKEQSHAGDSWHAIGFHTKQHGHGTTPEEAVANLWLARKEMKKLKDYSPCSDELWELIGQAKEIAISRGKSVKELLSIVPDLPNRTKEELLKLI